MNIKTLLAIAIVFATLASLSAAMSENDKFVIFPWLKSHGPIERIILMALNRNIL